MIIGSRALSKLPFDQAIIFNDKDLLIMVNTQVGFRLRNICDEVGRVFSISALMKENTEVFGEIELKERVNAFLRHFTSKTERFFVTHKGNFIFFDTVEQAFLRKSLSSPGLSCSVDIYKIYENCEFQLIDYRSLDKVNAKIVIRYLDDCAVREVIPCSHAYKSNIGGRRRVYGEKVGVEFTKTIFDEYSYYKKLKLITNKKSFNRYFKLLKANYHPDRTGSEDSEIFKIICEDYDKLKNTEWYHNLPNEKQEEKKESKENSNKTNPKEKEEKKEENKKENNTSDKENKSNSKVGDEVDSGGNN